MTQLREHDDAATDLADSGRTVAGEHRPSAIETVGLVKVFGETRAVDGIDLTVPAGAVYGVLGPLTFASNVFVDPKTMPGWVQAFVNVNPISHLATAARGLMHGAPVGTEIGWVLLWSAGLVAVFAPLTMRIYNSER